MYRTQTGKHIMHVNNIFQKLPDVSREEIFENIVSNEKVTVERIISGGQHSPPDFWYDQSKNELVFLLKGSALLSFEDGGSIELMPGDYMLIEAHRKHRVEKTAGDTETIWLAIHY